MRSAWKNAAQRLGVDPNRLAHVSLDAMAARQVLLEAQKLQGAERAEHFEIARSFLEEIEGGETP